jgi:hypothetical protein
MGKHFLIEIGGPVKAISMTHQVRSVLVDGQVLEGRFYLMNKSVPSTASFRLSITLCILQIRIQELI